MTRRLGWFGVLLFTASELVACAPRWALDEYFSGNCAPLLYVPSKQSIVALTIHDAPDPDAETTPMILDVLARHGAHATFFLISRQITPANEHVVHRMLAEGHEIGNHMATDRPSSGLSLADFGEELDEADATLRRFSDLRWFRPGAGRATPEMRCRAEKLGYRTVLADIYPFDHYIRSAGWIRHHVAATVRPGSIVVLHDRSDRGQRTAKALDQLLPVLAAKGYRILTLSQLLAEANADSEKRATKID